MNNAPDKSASIPMDSGCSSPRFASEAGEAEELGRLVGVIAHEIKNPLSTIKVNLRLVDEELQNGLTADTEQRLARARRKLAVIDKETARLEQILDGFLRYADRTQPHLAAVDVNSLVGDMIDFFLPQAMAHSITMRQALYHEPLVCQLDAGMLKQAILNLFINSQQAIAGSGELMVRTARDPGTPGFAQIQISDTGKGIPADRLGRIFEPYQSTKPAGSGLGLPTVKKIIDAHKGTISVVSEPGKGTAFTIALPLWEGAPR